MGRLVRWRRASLGVLLLFCVAWVSVARAQQPAVAPSPPTFGTTSRLVFLDVTVLDKEGQPVVRGLGEDDFTIKEAGKPQKIFSFEAPDVTEAGRGAGGKVPLTILVLDLLNTELADAGFERQSVREYLAAQPEVLRSPTELLVMGNVSLKTVQTFTRSKASLLAALDGVPAAVPFKLNASFLGERFEQSIDALQQIGLQNRGVPGRKLLLWMGHGGPAVSAGQFHQEDGDAVKRMLHDTTNLLVDARVSLHLIFPPARVKVSPLPTTLAEAADAADPFAGELSFAELAQETGGQFLSGRSDLPEQMERAQSVGENSYTLTYQPTGEDFSGGFRPIAVSVRGPGLRVIAKRGYYAPEKLSAVNEGKQVADFLGQAVSSAVLYGALQLSLSEVDRQSASKTIGFTARLRSRDLLWQPAGMDASQTNLILAVASLDGRREVLSSKLEQKTATARTRDQKLLLGAEIPWPVLIGTPRDTQSVRVVVLNTDNGRMGAAEIRLKDLRVAP